MKNSVVSEKTTFQERRLPREALSAFVMRFRTYSLSSEARPRRIASRNAVDGSFASRSPICHFASDSSEPVSAGASASIWSSETVSERFCLVVPRDGIEQKILGFRIPQCGIASQRIRRCR